MQYLPPSVIPLESLIAIVLFWHNKGLILEL